MLFCHSWCSKAISKLKYIKDIAERWCACLSKFWSAWQDKVCVLWNTFSSCGKILYFVSFKAFTTLESTERPQRWSDHFADVSPLCSPSNVWHRKSLHACITFSATYSAWLQDCSTSHPMSAIYLNGCVNPHQSRENHLSSLIIEVSDHLHVWVTHHVCPHAFLACSQHLLHESS